MNQRKRREPHFTSDPTTGDPIVIVPLPEPWPAAIVDRFDFERLVDGGLSTQWFFGKGLRGLGYVRVAPAMGECETVARLIVQAPRGRRVVYRDGNVFNLRRGNLMLKRGKATRVGNLEAAKTRRQQGHV